VVAGLVRSLEVDMPAKESIADPAAWISEQFRRFPRPGAQCVRARHHGARWSDDPAVGPRTVTRAIIGSREYQSF